MENSGLQRIWIRILLTVLTAVMIYARTVKPVDLYALPKKRIRRRAVRYY